MNRNPFAHIKAISEYMTMANPNSILDIGVYNGKIGFTVREVLELANRNNGYSAPWEIRVDGIEVSADMIKPHIKSLYANVVIGDAIHIIDQLPNYDLIVAEDILSQYTKLDGWIFLDKCAARANRFLLLTVELGDAWKSNAIFKHIYDVRRSSWFLETFKPFSVNFDVTHYPNYDYGIFLISKERYLKYRGDAFLSKEHYPKDVPPSPIREKLSLHKDPIKKINLAPFEKYIDDEGYKRFFFSNNFTEHYQFLAYISTRFNDAILFDIGTNFGYSALALSLNSSNKIISYDVTEMRKLALEDQLTRIEFNIGNVLNDERLLLSPMILLDTYHDGIFEKSFLEHLYQNQYKGYLLLDDIHLNTEMLVIWNSIDFPKEDITDLGHWSGTGIVHFTG